MNYSRIVELRLKNKLSVDELLKMLDVPVTNIKGWENGEKAPTALEYQKLALFFNVSIEYLMGLTDKKSSKSAKANNAKASNNKKTPIFSRWFYIALPIAMLFVLVGLAFVMYEANIGSYEWVNVSVYDVIFKKTADGFINHDLCAFGILMILINIFAIVYYSLMISLNKQNMTKLNLSNTIINGVWGLINLFIGSYFFVSLGGYHDMIWFGYIVYIVWGAMAIYAIVLSILGVIKMQHGEDIALPTEQTQTLPEKKVTNNKTKED